MRILHTADWHIGQTLNGWSRDHEHESTLAQLADLVKSLRIDALLVAGDVFDGINPSGEAQRRLYSGIAGLLRANPMLQIVLTSGNHDPAQRLEAPEALLNALGVHVLGTLTRRDDRVDIARHLVPLTDSEGVIRAHVLAVPFLRQADLPGLQLGSEDGAEPAVSMAARALHSAMTDQAKAIAQDLPLLAIGHLTCAGGLESEGAERRILIGGEHAVPPDIFPRDLRYVALGHLHKPQSLDGGRVRYSGSLFPLSASEISYSHGVTLLDLSEGFTPQHIPLTRPVAMHRLPAKGLAPLPEILAALSTLDLDPTTPRAAQPFLYLSVLADRPANLIATELETLIDTLPVRLAGLSIARADAPALPDAPPPSLAETSPEDLFRAAFEHTHGIAPTGAHLAAFRDALSEI